MNYIEVNGGVREKWQSVLVIEVIYFKKITALFEKKNVMALLSKRHVSCKLFPFSKESYLYFPGIAHVP